MALYSIDGRGRTKQITYTPYEAEFNLWRSRLTSNQVDAIRSELWNRIDGDEIHTAGWMPGNDWTGTVWEPIYTDACQYNVELSGYCFCGATIKMRLSPRLSRYRYSASIWMRARIASPRMLPWPTSLPHLKCSPRDCLEEHWK